MEGNEERNITVGGNIPAVVPEPKNASEAVEVLVAKAMPFRYVQNTSGTTLILPSVGANGISLIDGEKSDLFTLYNEDEINQGKRDFVLAEKAGSIKVFKSLQEMKSYNGYKRGKALMEYDEYGVILHVEKGTNMTAQPNEFDDRLAEAFEKEAIAEEKAKELAGASGRTRSTTDAYKKRKAKQKKSTVPEFPNL